jgi:hypothetical protein
MCDYSLHAVKSRDAAIGDVLVTTKFNEGYGMSQTVGLCTVAEKAKLCVQEATCLRPGTELRVEAPVRAKFQWLYVLFRWRTVNETTATFRKIHEDISAVHHDALEFADGKLVTINSMALGQVMTVLQVPVDKSVTPPVPPLENSNTSWQERKAAVTIN